MKKFVCVEFAKEKKCEVVFKKWLINSTTCRWPKKKTSNIEQMVKDCILPEDDWLAYQCKILKQSGTKSILA